MKHKYRPEIDGLRAIAVVAVILYHAQITILGHQPFKGGFIGVDIFFVISGYLITSIILKELVTTGAFSFKHFYERRIRRILPALLFVMLVSLPVAWICLYPDSLIDFSKSILYSLSFSSNFYFHYTGQIYGAESGLLKPFLHTWSLSVEEQFYVLFPLVFLVIFKYFRKYLIHILIFGFLISLVLADWGSKNHPSFNFYTLPTRGWELIAGSVLAYFEISKRQRNNKKILNLFLPAVGLILIFHSIIYFNDKMFHPSLYTLSPIIGTCLIIWFAQKDELCTKILSSKLFVGIGLISYSLYLWHYPIFAFARVLDIFGNNIFKELFTILILLFFSILSFYLIERPFRNKKNKFILLINIIIISIFIIIFFNYYVIRNDGFKKRFPKIFQDKLTEYHYNFNLHQKEGAKKVVLIGDSHAETLQFNLNEEIKKNDLSLFRLRTRLYLNDFNLIDRRTKKIIRHYAEDNLKIDDFLKKNSDLIVIFHQKWSYLLLETERLFDEEYKKANDFYHLQYLDPIYHQYLEPIGIQTSSLEERQNYIKEGLRSIIKKIISQGHKLILVYPVPEMGFHVPKMTYRKYLIEGSIPVLFGSYKIFEKRNELIFEILDSIKSPNIYRVYPHKIFCNKQIKNSCIANDKNNFFYSDSDHLSLRGSKYIVNEIISEIKKIDLESN